MDDRKIGIFLTNLYQYTCGNLIGQWLELPCTREQLNDVYRNIYMEEDMEYFITDYHVPISQMYHDFNEYTNLDWLNYLAGRQAELSDEEFSKYKNIIESGIFDGGNVTEYINLTYNLDKFNMLPVENDYSLGEFLVNESHPEIKSLTVSGMQISNFINYEELGYCAAINMNGYYGDKCFIYQNEYIENVIDKIPDNYIIVPHSVKELGTEKEMKDSTNNMEMKGFEAEVASGSVSQDQENYDDLSL